MKKMVKVIIHICIVILFFHTFSALAEDKTMEENKKHTVQKVEKNNKKNENTKNKLESIAFEKMDSNQIYSYIESKIEKERHKERHGFFTDLGDAIVPIAVFSVPVAFLSIFPISIFLFLLFRFRSIREKQITLRTMSEHGVLIPPEMFLENQKGKGLDAIDKDCKSGFLFTLSSVGLIIFLFLKTPQGFWSVGLVPFLLGIGYLISWRLAYNNSKKGHS